MSTPLRLAAFGCTMVLAFGGAFGVGAAFGTPLGDDRPVDHSEMTDMEDVDMQDMDMDMSGMADRPEQETR